MRGPGERSAPSDASRHVRVLALVYLPISVPFRAIVIYLQLFYFIFHPGARLPPHPFPLCPRPVPSGDQQGALCG